nr:HNH endonuclease [Xenorhabdus cabanillasii]
MDHIIPIQGEADVLFWSELNHPSLCQPCHNRKTVQTDLITKAKRKQGIYQEREAEGASHAAGFRSKQKSLITLASPRSVLLLTSKSPSPPYKCGHD